MTSCGKIWGAQAKFWGASGPPGTPLAPPLFPGLSGLAGNMLCVMADSAANDRVFNIEDHVVYSRRVNLKESLSERHAVFNSALRKKR